MDVFTVCLEIASKTIKVTQQYLTDYMDAVKAAHLCRMLYTPIFLVELLEVIFRKQLPVDFDAVRSTNPLLSGNSSILLSIHTHEK